MHLFRNTKQTVLWIISAVLAVAFFVGGIMLRSSVGDVTAVKTPVLELTTKSVELKIGDKFDALSYIKQATGTKGQDLTKDVSVPTISTKVPGEYDVTYKYTGLDANSDLSAALHVTVKSADKTKTTDKAETTKEKK